MHSNTTCALACGARSFGMGVRLTKAFTLIELLVVSGVLALLAALLVPASAHIRPNAQAIQCLSNLRRLASACEMYAEDNSGKIASAYPSYNGFTNSWCAGTAQTGGLPGSYLYGGADPAGIKAGVLWPYTRTLGLYHCPTDHRVADASGVSAQFKGKPILRSVSMNSFMNGTSYGVANTTNQPVYTKETQIKLPKQTFLLVDEDQDSVNDCMFTVDVGGSLRFLDLPTRAHRFGYSICFVDGRAEIHQFRDEASKNWRVGSGGGLNDWMWLTNVATHPL